MQRLLQWKTISLIYSECVFIALIIQHAMPMCRVLLTSVVCPAVRHFSTLCYKRHDLQGEKVTVHKMCVFIFPSILSKPFLIIRRIKWVSIINIHVLMWSTCYSFQILMRLIFWTDFRKSLNQNVMKIRPVEVELFHTADGRTDRHDETNNRFSQFCESA